MRIDNESGSDQLSSTLIKYTIDCVLVSIHSLILGDPGTDRPQFPLHPTISPWVSEDATLVNSLLNSSSEIMRAHESLRSNGSDSRALITPSFSLGSGLVPHKKFINAFPVLSRYSLLAVEDNSRVIPRQVDDKHKAALEIITYVGMGLSIMGNILSVLVQWKWA